MTQDALWVGWLVLVGLAVVVLGSVFWLLERPGLEHGKGELTLTRTLRRWLGLRPESSRRWVLVPLFILAAYVVIFWLVVLVDHIVGG